MFWISVTWLNEEKRKNRYLFYEELSYCPACGIELKKLRKNVDETD